MAHSRTIPFLFLLADFFLVGGSTAGITDIPCSTNDECTVFFPNTECNDVHCICSSTFTLSSDGYYCEKVKIGTSCNPTDFNFCSSGVPGSLCDDDTSTCQCAAGTGLIVQDGWEKCVPAITGNSDCNECISSGGVCTTVVGGSPDACGCPPNWGSSNPANTLATGCDIPQVPTGGCCTNLPPDSCSDPHASCKVATDLSFDSFCECNRGYVAVPRPYDPVHADCREVINSAAYSVCSACEDNGGTCYLDEDDDPQCLCPATKSSSSTNLDDACDTNHFVLDCHPLNPSLCFIPGNNPYYQSVATQLKNGDSMLYMRGHSDDPTCHFIYDQGSDQFCLDYTAGHCGVLKVDTKIATSYTAWVVLQHNSLFLTTADLCSYNYCKFDKLTHVVTSAVDVVQRKNLATQGEVVRPETEIKIENRFGVELGELTGGKLGSQVKLIIQMTDNKGVYTAMRAEVCVASNSLNLQVPGTQAVVFIMNGCPAENSFISGGINFYPTDNPLVIETQLFGLPKFAVGDYVFFHCAVRVCINSDDCEVNCDTRRKRSAVLPGGALPSSVHQLVPVSKRTADKSLYQALESPDLEQKVIGIRVRDNDQSTEEDRHGPTEPERDDRTRYENDDRRPVDTRPSEYGRRPYQDRRGSVYDDYYRSIYDRRQPDESERSNNAVLVISIIVSSLVTLVVSAVLVFVCYVRPRRLQMAQAQQSEKV